MNKQLLSIRCLSSIYNTLRDLFHKIFEYLEEMKKIRNNNFVLVNIIIIKHIYRSNGIDSLLTGRRWQIFECDIHIMIVFHFLLPEYSTFAKIDVGSRGRLRIRCGGYTYGQLANNRFVWRCTANKNRKRCSARIRTRIIEGYEMIRTTKCSHNHDRVNLVWISFVSRNICVNLWQVNKRNLFQIW